MTDLAVIDDAPPVATEAEPLRFPVSSSQQRCWFIDQMNPGNPALNVALRWEIKGVFTSELIERAFQGVIDRHEILRTRFVETCGEPVQEVADGLTFELKVTDLTGLPDAERMDAALDLGSREAHVPFDLAALPLVRAHLVRLAEDRAVLLVTVHQICFDGWSIRIIAREFGAMVAAVAEGCPPSLPELPLQYGDYARWQEAWFASGGFDEETAYWRKQLAGAPYFEVPPDKTRPPVPTYNGVILAEILPPGLSEGMEGAAKRHNVTLFSLGCAITASVLHGVTGAPEIVLGTQIAGRDDPDLEGLIGVFINNLVLRLDAQGDPAFADFLARTSGVVQEALIHQRMPFHRLVTILNPPRDASRTPLISVNFTVLHEVMDDARYGPIDLYGKPSLSAGSLYDLNFFLVWWPSGWRMALEYNPDLFERATAEGILKLWRATLERVLEEPGFRLSSVGSVPREAVTPHPVAHLRDSTSPSGRGEEAAATSPSPLPSGERSSRLHSRRPGEGDADASEVEEKLAAIWRDLLKVPEIGPDADFFALGGHSLLAVRMIARVAETFGVRIGVVRLFQHPTLRAFAGAIAAARAQTSADTEDWKIVRIQPAGDKTPVIAINNTVAYYNLARQIGTDRPFLGIQLFDPDAPRALEPRPFEEIAADYVRLIRQARPHGPYVLMGLCVAGALAYAAADQLRREGEDVPLVIMADTWLPNYLRRLPFPGGTLFRWSYRRHVARHRWALFRAGQLSRSDLLQSYRLVWKLGVLKAAARLRLIRMPDGKEDWKNRWFLPHLETARDRWSAPARTGDVALLRSQEMVLPFADPALGWTPLVEGRLCGAAVPGWHVDMFQHEGATKIAAMLKPLLAAVDEGGAP